MDDYLQWLLACLGICLLAAWLGFRGFKRTNSKRKSKRAKVQASSREETQRMALDEAARQQARRKAAAQEAARLEALLSAEREAARERQARRAAEDAARSAAQSAAAEESARLAAARVVAEVAAKAQQASREQAAKEAARVEAAKAEAERVAKEKVAREEAARAAQEKAARVHAARDAARAQAARAAAEEAARRESKGEDTPPSAPPAASAKTPDQTLVMVADDSKIVRVKTGRLLAQHQYRVSYASDGLDAAQQIEASMPDVVITDVEMPGMDGFELTRLVRQNPRTAHIPVIMITAADERHREGAINAGVSVLLGKPYSEDELIAHIRAAMSHGETRSGALA